MNEQKDRGRRMKTRSRLHTDLIKAREAEVIHEKNPFEPNTRIWRFFNKVREANRELRNATHPSGGDRHGE